VIAVTTDDAAWRTRVRLGWVTAETALLSSDPELAIELGRSVQRTARNAMAWRHAVKSELVLGVALHAAGRSRAATRVLRTAVRGATRLGLVPLLVPAHSVLADILGDRAPQTAARERRHAHTAQSMREDPADGQSIG
jgi:ATP/maltotriose-dependent transcriptional regulator MalT